MTNNYKTKKANSRSDFVRWDKLLSKSKRSTRVSNQLFNIKYLSDSKRSQVTIFIILAIMIVSAIILVAVFRNNIFPANIPSDIKPVYEYYLSCIENDLETGSAILGQQAGYIEQPEFSSGSEYMPFSNQLDFLGTGIPYWYYISGNGIAKEQIPSKEKMQEQLNDFLEERIIECDFSGFEQRGYEISLGTPKINSAVKENKITADVRQALTIKFDNSTWNSKSHSAEISSGLGSSYELAKKIYEKNKQTMFLENYGVDILRLYAPVDGSEIGCSTKLWQVSNVRTDLINALNANIPEIKIKGDYYALKKPENKYFIQDIGVNPDSDVNFMFSNQWPVKIEISPSEDNFLRAEPVGLQEGLGMLGFCYTPYHFVYDFAYPVLIQVYSQDEIFQFPVVVYINKNHPRVPVDAEALPDVVPELCRHKISEQTVHTYNTQLSSVETNIKFKCFDTTCPIGQTEKGILKTNFPQCTNGYIITSAEGYETKKYLASTVSSNEHIIVLDKKYSLDLEIQKNNQETKDYAVITFTKNPETNPASTTVSYPEQKQIELTEGQYQIKIYIYSNSTISLKGGEMQQCTDVPKTGILGIFGATEEKCFPIKIPDQIISFAVSGGGKQMHYITETELKSSDKIIINSGAFPIPTSPQQLQENYNLIENQGLDIYVE